MLMNEDRDIFTVEGLEGLFRPVRLMVARTKAMNLEMIYTLMASASYLKYPGLKCCGLRLDPRLACNLTRVMCYALRTEGLPDKPP